MRRVFEAVNRSWEPDLSLLDPDVVLDTTNAVFDRAVYRGHEGVRQYLANQREVWESQRFEPEELIAAVGESGDRLVSVRERRPGRDRDRRPLRAASARSAREGSPTSRSF